MTISYIRTEMAKRLESVDQIITAFSKLNGIPPTRNVDHSELPACLIFREGSTYTRNTLTKVRHTCQFRIDLLIAVVKVFGRIDEVGLSRLDKTYDNVVKLLTHDPCQDGLVISSDLLSDEGEAVLSWGGKDYLGTSFVWQFYFDTLRE